MRTSEEEETRGSLLRLCMAPAISAWLSLGSGEVNHGIRTWVSRTDLEPTSYNKTVAASGRLAAASEPTGHVANQALERICYRSSGRAEKLGGLGRFGNR